MGAKNRRKFVRQHVDVSATVVPDDGEPVIARLRDMSVGGAFVELSDGPPFGTNIRLEFSLCGTRGDVPAVVRWSRDGGMGVQFEPLGGKTTYAITEYLARWAESPGAPAGDPPEAEPPGPE